MSRFKFYLKKNVWSLCAENVVTGVIDIVRKRPEMYLYDFVNHGMANPINNAKAVNFSKAQEVINSDIPIDVYIKCSENDGQVIITI
jgi:hypothetical protein